MGNPRKPVPAAVVLLLMLVASWSVARLSGADAAPNIRRGAADPRGFAFTFVDVETGEPVRYNACQPLHYVVNPALAPPNGVSDIRTAFEMTALASGMKFVYDGPTDEVTTPDRPAYQPDRYGDRWAPILISWTEGLPVSSTAVDAEGKRPIAAAGSHIEVNEDGRSVYVTGAASFDATVTDLRNGFGGETWGQAMVHELGHVLGLGHVDDPASVMNPVIGLRPAAFGGGDRAGLWLLGIGSPCIAAPRTP